jgi:hypothetical protein
MTLNRNQFSRPMYKDWDDYIASQPTRKFPNMYEQHPEKFLPDLDEALGNNRPDSRNEGDK